MATSSSAPDGTDTNTETLTSLESLFDPPTDSICPFGDIKLVVDDNLHPTLKIRVSSCILAMVSLVFKALFSDKYAEGQAKPTENGREILVKDNPQSMKILCRLLHHKSPYDDEPHPDWRHIDLIGLAIVADKYDCVEDIRMPVKGMFYDLWGFCEPLFAAGEEVLSHSVAAAFILDQPEVFRHFSKLLVMHSKRSIRPESFDDRTNDFLPPGLISTLAAQQIAVRNLLTRHIDTFVTEFSRTALSLNKADQIANFTQSLSNANVLPIEFNDSEFTVAGLLENLTKKVNVPVLQSDGKSCGCDSIFRGRLETDPGSGLHPIWASASGEAPRWHDPICPQLSFVSPVTLKHADLLQAAQNVWSCAPGICLDCAKRGTKGKDREGEEGGCRVEHPKPWKLEEQVVGEAGRADLSCFFVGDEPTMRKKYGKPKWWENAW